MALSVTIARRNPPYVAGPENNIVKNSHSALCASLLTTHSVASSNGYKTLHSPMSSSRVFRGCRVMLAAAKAGTPGRSSAATKPTPPSKPSSTTRTTGRPAGILKVAPVSPALRKFLGVPEVSRTDAVKKIWEYIKLHNLQNPADKRQIYCDEKLKSIFNGKDKVGFLEIGKLLSPHFVKTD